MTKRWGITVAAVVTMSVASVAHAPRVRAQDPGAAAAVTFDVASIKPNKSGDQRIMF